MATLLEQMPKLKEVDEAIAKKLAELKLLRRMRKWAEEQEAINGVLVADATKANFVNQHLVDGHKEVAYAEPAGLKPVANGPIASGGVNPGGDDLDDDLHDDEDFDHGDADELEPEPPPLPPRKKRGAP